MPLNEWLALPAALVATVWSQEKLDGLAPPRCMNASHTYRAHRTEHSPTHHTRSNSHTGMLKQTFENKSVLLIKNRRLASVPNKILFSPQKSRSSLCFFACKPCRWCLRSWSFRRWSQSYLSCQYFFFIVSFHICLDWNECNCSLFIFVNSKHGPVQEQLERDCIYN